MKMTINRLTRTLGLLAVVGLTAVALAEGEPAGPPPAMQPKTNTTAEFEKLKSLVGTWRGTANHGETAEEATVVFTLTAGGTAVVETVFPGKEHEMKTIYHMDGDQLVLTHYCMLGNQPTMALEPSDDPSTMTFVCTGGTNMDSEDEPHMHQAVHQFAGDDQIQSSWSLYAAGGEVHCAVLSLKRVTEEDE